VPDATVTETTETEEAQTEPRASDPTPASQSNGVGGSDDFHEQYLGEETRIEGMVKRWNQERGYGFLTPKMPDGEFCKDDKNDIFVHQSAVQLDGYRALLETEEVSYTVSRDDSGRLKAAKVLGPGGGELRGCWAKDEHPLKGKVSRWRSDKGFGFITPDAGGEDIFVHQSVIQSTGFRVLEVGDEAEYITVPDGERVKAGKVTGKNGRPFKGGEPDGAEGKGKGKGGGRGFDKGFHVL